MLWVMIAGGAVAGGWMDGTWSGAAWGAVVGAGACAFVAVMVWVANSPGDRR